MRKSFIVLSSLLAMSVAALAQDWPTRAVTIVVPFSAGSTPDVAARIVSDRLQARLGQPFVVENKPGASGNLGTAAVAKATPDGYTIGVSIIGPLAINTLLMPSMPYDPAKDLALISIITSQPSALVVSKELAVTKVGDLINLLKSNPGKYNYGSIGNGSLSHLAMEALALQSGSKVVHIPFRGSPDAITALLRNDVQMGMLPIGAVAPLAENGQLRLLAVSAAQRMQQFPDLPTLEEVGLTEVVADAWVGLIAPRSISADIASKLESEAKSILAEPAVREKLQAQMTNAIGSSAAEFQARVDADFARWNRVIKAGNIRIE